jgi:hypothetical protein
MIFPGSRYEKMGTFAVTRPDGRIVQALQLPLPGPSSVRGYYRRLHGQQLDLIANAFLTNATAFWRLCDANNAVVPDSLAARDLVGIPLVAG